MKHDTGARDRIARKAMELFVERGVQGVSVRDVAEAAGCNPSTIYTHWKSFPALAEGLFREGYAGYGRRLAEAAAAPGTFMDRLDGMVRLICRLHDEDETLFGFLLLTQHGYLRDVPRDGSNPVDVLCGATAAAMEAGEIPRGDPALAAMAVIGIIVQPATARLYGRIGRTLGGMSDEIVSMCLKALS